MSGATYFSSLDCGTDEVGGEVHNAGKVHADLWIRGWFFEEGWWSSNGQIVVELVGPGSGEDFFFDNTSDELLGGAMRTMEGTADNDPECYAEVVSYDKY